MLTIQEQVLGMQKWQQFGARWSSSKLEALWTGFLNTGLFNHEYVVGMVYKIGTDPKVWVLYPNIDQTCPHLNWDLSLCLYYQNDPDLFIWTSDNYLSDTIIPWSLLWLEFYDLWLVDGIWYGPEGPHGDNLGLGLEQFWIKSDGRRKRR